MKTLGIFLKVRSKEAVVFDGPVKSITSFNDKGEFDVLPQHANFISLIKRFLSFRDFNGTKREIRINNAIMRVEGQRVEVFVGIRK